MPERKKKKKHKPFEEWLQQRDPALYEMAAINQNRRATTTSTGTYEVVDNECPNCGATNTNRVGDRLAWTACHACGKHYRLDGRTFHQESATTTSDIALFMNRLDMPMVRRGYSADPFFSRKKKN